MMKRSDFEIMAPVGSYDSLTAAIQGGADSVYFGIEGLNMRARSSNNFTIDDLREIVRICNEHRIKSYLTVNTVIYDEDIPLLHRIIDAAKEAGLSAIIASDVAAMTYAREIGVRGAFIDPAEYFQYRGVAILCPFCRCGGTGPGVEYGTGSPYSRSYFAGSYRGAGRRTGTYRDVLSRGIVHGCVRQMLFEPSRNECFGESGGLYADLSPFIRSERQGDR